MSSLRVVKCGHAVNAGECSIAHSIPKKSRDFECFSRKVSTVCLNGMFFIINFLSEEKNQ